MKWKVIFAEESLREVLNLDKRIVKRMIQKLESISTKPRQHLTKLDGYDEYKLRVGDYRVLVLLSEKDRYIIIESVGHRKDIHKKLKRRRKRR